MFIPVPLRIFSALLFLGLLILSVKYKRAQKITATLVGLTCLSLSAYLFYLMTVTGADALYSAGMLGIVGFSLIIWVIKKDETPPEEESPEEEESVT